MPVPTQHTAHAIGTLVCVNRPISAMHGEMCRVTSAPDWVYWHDGDQGIGQYVDLPPVDGHTWAFAPNELVPIDYDGHEPCAWDEAIFHPFKDSVPC